MLKRRALAVLTALLLLLGFVPEIPLLMNPSAAALSEAEEEIPIFEDSSGEYSFAERAADAVARLSLAQKSKLMLADASSAYAATAINSAVANSGLDKSQVPAATKGLASWRFWNEASHGFSGSFSYPTAIAAGATWDKEAFRKTTSHLGETLREAAIRGNRASTNTAYFSPTINLGRDPRWGRNDECYSEDPYQTAVMANFYTSAFEGVDPDTGKVLDPQGYRNGLTTLKHYTANNHEALGNSPMRLPPSRIHDGADTSLKALRDYFVKPYASIIKSGSASAVMGAYSHMRVDKPGTRYDAYNDNDYVDGTAESTSASGYLMANLLRQTYGLKGHLVSDCDSFKSAGYLLYTGTPAERAGGTIRHPEAGESYAWSLMYGGYLECTGGVGGGFFPHRYDREDTQSAMMGVQTDKGTLTEHAFDFAAHNMLTSRFTMGEMDTTQTSATNATGFKILDDATARIAAQGGGNNNNGATPERVQALQDLQAAAAVLFKNETGVARTGKYDFSDGKILPLRGLTGNLRIAIVGAAQTDTFAGGYNMGGLLGRTFLSHQKNITDSITAANPGATITWDYITSNTPSSANLTTIQDADLAIVMVNSNGDLAEDRDRQSIALRNGKETLVDTCFAQNENLILLVESAGPVELDKFVNMPKAIMWCGPLGSVMKNAFGPNLTGEHNPSGRTNQIWYRYVCNADNYGHANDTHWPTVNDPVAIAKSQQPRIDHYNLYPMDNTYEGSTGTNSGRTYMYNPNNYLDPADKDAPTYPFGYGLSYTTFKYDNLSITRKAGTGAITPDDTVTVRFTVENTGSYDGNEISQLYVSHPGASADRLNPNTKNGLPIQVLRGFEKTFVKAGETETVTMELKIADLALFSETSKKFEVSPGQYTLKIGSTSTDIRLNQNFDITGSWTPVPETVTLKIHQEGDMDAPSMNDGTIIEERLFFQGGREIFPKVCVSLNNEELVGYITYESLSFIDRLPQSRPYPDGMTVVLSSNRPEVAEVVNTPEGQKVFAKGIGPATITATVTYNGVTTVGEQVVYVVSEPSVDLQLHDLKIDGTTVPGFARATSNYSYALDESATAMPTVTASGSTLEGMAPIITVTPPATLPGTYVIRVQDPADPAVFRNVTLGVGWNLLPADSTNFKTGASSVTGKKWVAENSNANASWVTGGLRITTESAGDAPKNLYMLSGLGDWGVTTDATVAGTLTADEQQYGLAIVQDNDNYIRFTAERNTTNAVRVVQAVHGVESVISSINIGALIPGVSNPDPAGLHFRIDSEGENYTFSVSGNGTAWAEVGSMTKPGYACPRIAPWANNGGNGEAPGLAVTFSGLTVSDVSETNPKLSGITVNGIPLERFSPSERNYNIFLDLDRSNTMYSIANGAVPTVAATAIPGQTVQVTPPAALPGKATITVTSALAVRTYTLRFVDYPDSDHMVGGVQDGYWTILNEDADSRALVKGRGIKLTSQPFSLHEAGMKNIYVRPGAAFSYIAAAKVYLPVAPNQEAQQVAFGIYENADNYLKLSIEYRNGARVARFAKYENGVATQTHWTNLDDDAIPQNYDPNRDTDLVAWFRFEKTSDIYYEASVSFGGDALDEENGWVTVGSCVNPTNGSNTNGVIIADYQNPQIFVAALNESKAPAIDAYVESVMLNKIEGLTEDYDNLKDGFNAVLDYAVPDAADVVAELPTTASFYQKSEVYEGLKLSGFATDLPNLPYGYQWAVKGEPAGMFDIASNGTVTAKGSGDGTLSLVLKTADFMGGLEEVFHTVDVAVKPYNYAWKQVIDFGEIQDGDRILIVSDTTGGALTNKVTPEIPATSISNVPVYGFVSTPVVTDGNNVITSPVTNGMIWTVEDRGNEACSGGSTANPSYGNRHLRFSNAYPDNSTDETGAFSNVAMAGTMNLTRVGPENAGAGTIMVMRPATHHAVALDARLDWCFLDHGNGQCSLANYMHGGSGGSNDMMFALAGIHPETVGAPNGFALSGTNATGATAVNTIRNRALLKFYKEVDSTLVGEVSIGDVDTVKVGNTLTADVSALAIDPDLYGDNFGTLSYQWYRDGAAITGANSKTYTVWSADKGKQVTVQVTSSTSAGSVISNAVTVIPREGSDTRGMLEASMDDGKISCDFVNFTEGSVSVSFLLAAYDGNNRLVQAFVPNIVEVAGEGNGSASWDVTMADYEGCTFKVFAWDEKGVPLSNAVTLN